MDEIVRAVVRAEQPVDTLADVGVLVDNVDGVRRIEVPAGFAVMLPLVDLAVGFVASWATGTELREWATVMLMLSDVEFTDSGSSDYDQLLEGLWAASAGEEVPEESLGVARRLAG